MSQEASPTLDRMDISLSSDASSGELSNSSPVLNCSNDSQDKHYDNSDINRKYDESEETCSTFIGNTSASQNATNSHPLMYTSISPDYPDLIPEKTKMKHNYKQQQSQSMPNVAENASFEKQLQFDLPISKNFSELPDFPESPSALKKSLMFDLPLEVANLELSDTENDKSVYEAHLSSNLQNVALTMNEKEGNLNFLAHKKRSNKLRRIKVMHTEPSEESDVSSLDSISESLKSEHVFTGQSELNDEEHHHDDESPEPIEPLSAADERRHARHWQRMVLPEGEQRTIDMRVIEPYKRVLSHGGYLRAGGHTAIVIFSACFLPDRSRVDYVYVMDNLFLYILWTLERLVTDDYVLVYLHGGATKLPAFSWLKKCYQMVGRKLRKNLSHLYLVHPTLWIKTMLFMAKPFISSKFYRKISYVSSLKQLMVRVPLEVAAIPDKVKAYDSLHCVT